MAKLSEEIVREIRKSKRSTMALAVIYGVAAETVRDVRKRRTWKWLE